jgi:hypothetical protein
MGFTASTFDPKNEMGNVKLIKDPKIKHLKFPFKNFCLKFKFKQELSYLGLLNKKHTRIRKI